MGGFPLSQSCKFRKGFTAGGYRISFMEGPDSSGCYAGVVQHDDLLVAVMWDAFGKSNNAKFHLVPSEPELASRVWVFARQGSIRLLHDVDEVTEIRKSLKVPLRNMADCTITRYDFFTDDSIHITEEVNEKRARRTGTGNS